MELCFDSNQTNKTEFYSKVGHLPVLFPKMYFLKSLSERKFNLAILTNFISFQDFLTFPCYKETNDISDITNHVKIVLLST